MADILLQVKDLSVSVEDKDILKEFRSAMRRRAKTPALRTGSMKLAACGPDVVVVYREMLSGKDAFGNPAEASECALAINRARDVRWVEHNGHTYEIPAESAVWLDPIKKKAKK